MATSQSNKREVCEGAGPGGKNMKNCIRCHLPLSTKSLSLDSWIPGKGFQHSQCRPNKSLFQYEYEKKARSLGDSHALNGQAAPEEICRQSSPGGEEMETMAILANNF
jgi:hypothetical protein